MGFRTRDAGRAISVVDADAPWLYRGAMPKSATEVMNEVIVAAIIDAVTSLKAASNGLPNNLLRDLNAIHANTAAADLPAALQPTIAASVREAFTRLAKEGYTVAPSQGAGGPTRGPSHPPRPRDGQSPRPPGGGAPRNRRDARPGARPGSPKPPRPPKPKS